MLTQIKSEIRKNAFGVDLTRFVVVATMTLALAMGMKKFFVIFFFCTFSLPGKREGHISCKRQRTSKSRRAK